MTVPDMLCFGGESAFVFAVMQATINTVCALFPDHDPLQFAAQGWEQILKPSP